MPLTILLNGTSIFIVTSFTLLRNKQHLAGAQPGFCLGSGLKMKNFSDVTLITYFRWRNLYDVIKNDVACYFL